MLTLLSIGSAFLAYGISIWVGAERPVRYYTILIIFMFLYGLLTYVVGDIEYLRYRKKVGEHRPALTEEEKVKLISLRLPFIISLVVTSIVFFVFFFIYLFTKSWPFL